MHRRPSARPVVALIAALGLFLAACGDDDTEDAVSDDTLTEDTVTETPDDSTSDSAGDEETTTTTSGSAGADADDDEVVTLGGTVVVTGPFGDDELDLRLTEETSCSIEETSDEASASVDAGTPEGDRFSLDWSRLDEEATTATLVLDGTTWNAGSAGEDTDPPHGASRRRR